MRFSVTYLLAILFAQPMLAEELTWKTIPEFGRAIELPGCDVVQEGCGDHVSYLQKGPFGVNYYLTYFEAVRAGVGYGRRDNQSWYGPASLLHPGAIDIGGTVSGLSFRPRYVVKRFYDYDEASDSARLDQTHLLVFKLLDDGTSCIAETGGNSTAINEVARKQAEKEPGCAP